MKMYAKISGSVNLIYNSSITLVCSSIMLRSYIMALGNVALGLQLREGGKKGVYVENLLEIEVGSDQDVVQLLLLVRLVEG